MADTPIIDQVLDNRPTDFETDVAKRLTALAQDKIQQVQKEIGAKLFNTKDQ